LCAWKPKLDVGRLQREELTRHPFPLLVVIFHATLAAIDGKCPSTPTAVASRHFAPTGSAAYASNVSHDQASKGSHLLALA
jgi:hypothetical protein